MNHSSFGVAALIVVCLGAAGCGNDAACTGDEAASSECQKAPLERFEGTAVSPDPLPYTSGMDLTVDGVFGTVKTADGPPGEVSVVFEPFNWREIDQEALARGEMENDLNTSFEVSGDAIAVTAGRQGATKGLGANITVLLPPEFDGALVLRNQGDGPPSAYNGGVEVLHAANAWSLDVSTEKDGSCFVSSDGSVVSTRARCAGRIDAIGVSDYVDLASTGRYGDVSVIFRSVAGEGAGGNVTSEDGDIQLNYADGSSFGVEADLVGSGIIHLLAIDPSGCVTEGDDRSSMSITCGGGGPNYVVTGGTAGKAETPGEVTAISIIRSF